MNAAKVATQIADWMAEKVARSGQKGLVFGMSGGVDSAVVAALAVRAVGREALGVIMPCHSLPQDEQDARLAADALGLELLKVDLSPVFDLLTDEAEQALETPLAGMASANTKSRLRMVTLYAIAGTRRALVAGTGNLSELTIGYFTKYGDSGVDLLPLGNLVKARVYELARYLGVPQRVIEKAPSAGLWEGQTDEQEMGLTYADLDRYILTGEGPGGLAEKIERLRKASGHKRATPPIAPVDFD